MPKVKTAKKNIKKAKQKKVSPRKEKEGKTRKKKILKKEPSKKKGKKTEIKERETKPVRYFEGIGRRKTSIARVRLFTKGEKEFLVNGKPYNLYFPTFDLCQIATASLRKMGSLDRFRVLVKVKGGGIYSQAEAVRHGIARALVQFNPEFRKRLRRSGYLTRDPRMRERKKFGLKRARRAPQWQKR